MVEYVAVMVSELSEPERLVWAAFPRGAWADLRSGDLTADGVQNALSWGDRRVVRAEALAALLLGAGDAEPGCAPAVRLRGARITGRLDLRGATVCCPLVCEQPYEQLASCYTAIGQPGQARKVLYARERQQRDGKAPLARVWSRLQDLTVGYGYQPWRAALWLALLLAAGSIVFHISPPAPLQPGAAPHFNPVICTLDLLLPVVNLGQKYAFNPAGAEQWFSYTLIAAGWLLATTIAAGLARVLTRS